MIGARWSWTLVKAGSITMGSIPDDPEMDEDLEAWLDQIGAGLVLAVGVPGKRITIDATTLLDAWVAGGFAEKLPYGYRMPEQFMDFITAPASFAVQWSEAA